MPLKRLHRKVSSSGPVNWLREKTKKIFLPGFRGLPLYDVARFFWQQVRKVGLTERTSAISFNFILAIPPMVIFLFTLIPYLPISEKFIEQLYGLIQDVVPGKSNYQPILDFLDGIIKNERYGLLSIGFLLALFYSSNAMMGIMRAFDKNYPGFKKRSALERRLTALELTLILFLIMMVSLLLLVMQGNVLQNWIGIKAKWMVLMIENVRWLVIVLLFLASVSFIYRHAPFVQKKWNLINPGSVLAAGMMLIFTVLFSYWVSHFSRYNELYGSLGSILLLMLLIYVNSLVLLIGFELNVSINSLIHEADERKKAETNGKASG